MKKITCKECKQPCCEGYLAYTGVIDILPQNYDGLNLEKQIKRINLDGIPLIRINKYKWRCEWWDKEKNKCKHYSLRPDICKFWFCKRHFSQMSKGRVWHSSIYRLMFKRRGRPMKPKKGKGKC